MRIFGLVICFLVIPFLESAGQVRTAPEKVVPAINEIELWQQVGQQPYEFTWFSGKKTRTRSSILRI